MASYVRMSRNFVNLGKLYSLQPGSRKSTCKATNPLYRPGPPYVKRRPRFQAALGWAYFEDGSVFINAYPKLSYDPFEAEMNRLLPFILQPSPSLAQIRQEDPEQRRLITMRVGDAMPGKYKLWARNACDGQTIASENNPFQRIIFGLSKDNTAIVGATIYGYDQPIGQRLPNIIETAMRKFRGTLVDGILKPDVRPGNGLTLSRFCWGAESTVARSEENGGIMYTKSISGKPLSDQEEVAGHDSRTESLSDESRAPSSGKEANLDYREAQLRKREQQLISRQQQLIDFQQQLLRRPTRFPPRRPRFDVGSPVRPQRHHYPSTYKTSNSIGRRSPQPRTVERANVPNIAEGRGSGSPTASRDEALSISPDESSERSPSSEYEDPFSDFDIHDPTPPQSLAELRTQIELPRKSPPKRKRSPNLDDSIPARNP